MCIRSVMDYDVDFGVFDELICLQSAALGKVAFMMVIEAKEDNFSGGRKKPNPLHKEHFHIFESMGIIKLVTRWEAGL